MNDRVRGAIETEKRELNLRLSLLERLLEQLDHPPVRLTPADTAGKPRRWRQRPSETNAARRAQQSVVDAYDGILVDLRANGGRMEITAEEWSARLGVGKTAIGLALKFLRDDGLVVRERRGSVGRASIHRLASPERTTVVEPGVGIRDGRRLEGEAGR